MNFTISTISPVHIGKGSELQGNFEYLYFKDENLVAVIAPKKVLGVLGDDNLHQWIACIDNNQPLMPLLRDRKSDLRSVHIADRTFKMTTASDKPIRIQLHSGNRKPMIPGSSLKGAIRTALFAEWVLDNPGQVKDKRNLKDFRNNWSDKIINNLAFGNDPNHDIFRLLQVGDSYFSLTEAYSTNVINKHHSDWRIKSELTQVVEAIPAGQTAHFRICYNETLANRAGQNYFNRNQSNLQFNELFPMINSHTKRLLEDEIDYWDNSAGNPSALEDYLDEMKTIYEITNGCNLQQCVIRLGWGSGFRSMTGDWHGKMTDDDYYAMVRSIRPRHPEDLVFPKTTRFINGGVPLGFVKLSLKN